jgi:hypothetical protein
MDTSPIASWLTILGFFGFTSNSIPISLLFIIFGVLAILLIQYSTIKTLASLLHMYTLKKALNEGRDIIESVNEDEKKYITYIRTLSIFFSFLFCLILFWIMP